jgi:hypothetical protein
MDEFWLYTPPPSRTQTRGAQSRVFIIVAPHQDASPDNNVYGFYMYNVK